MSSILQRWSRKVAFGSTEPAYFHNGLPFEADGSLALENGGAIDRHYMGLPFSPNNRISVDLNSAAVYEGTGSTTYSVAGRLVVGT